MFTSGLTVGVNDQLPQWVYEMVTEEFTESGLTRSEYENPDYMFVVDEWLSSQRLGL